MSFTVDPAEKVNINILPETVAEEILQNLWFLYSTMEYEIPLDRGMGMNAAYVDRPIETAKAMAMADIYDKTEKYEPRATIIDILFETEYGNAKIRPVVEVEINGEYNS